MEESKTKDQKQIELNPLMQVVTTTIACTVATMPVSAYAFGTVSIVGILSNMLILPVIESTMLMGFVAVFLLSVDALVALSNVFVSAIYLQLRWAEIVIWVAGDIAAVDLSVIKGSSTVFLVLVLILVFIVLRFYPANL